MLNVWRIFMPPAIYLFPWGSLSIVTNLCFNQHQHIVFLGFVLDSLKYVHCLSETCKGVILAIYKNFNSGASHKIRTVASAVGCFIAALPGVKYGGLVYRNLIRPFLRNCRLVILLQVVHGKYYQKLFIDWSVKYLCRVLCPVLFLRILAYIICWVFWPFLNPQCFEKMISKYPYI